MTIPVTALFGKAMTSSTEVHHFMLLPTATVQEGRNDSVKLFSTFLTLTSSWSVTSNLTL